MNLETLIDFWIERDMKKSEKFVPFQKIHYQSALQDLKSRKQELIEGIESFYASKEQI